MAGKSPFSEDWRKCLQAHYSHVVRVGDVKTKKTLSSVLQGIGYSSDDLLDWEIRATMHEKDRIHHIDEEETPL